MGDQIYIYKYKYYRVKTGVEIQRTKCAYDDFDKLEIFIYAPQVF